MFESTNGAELMPLHPRDVARVVFELVDAGTLALDDDALLERIATWERLISWARGQQVSLISQLADRVREERQTNEVPVEVVAGEELSTALALGSAEASERVRVADQLSQSLWETHDVLLRGRIDYSKAALIAKELRGQSPQVAFAVEDAVLPWGSRCSRAQLKRKIDKALIEVDPTEADARYRRARSARRVCRPRPMANGMASIFMVLPAPDAMAVDACVQAAAKSLRVRGDVRTMDQLRADAMTAMAHHALATGRIGEPPERGEEEPVVTLSAELDEILRRGTNPARSLGETEVFESKSDGNLKRSVPRYCDPDRLYNPRHAIFYAPRDLFHCRPKGSGMQPPIPAWRREAESFQWGEALRSRAAISVKVPLDYLAERVGLISLDWTQLNSDLGASSGMSELIKTAEVPSKLPPPTLEGYGPIPPGLAAQIALAPDSIWSRILTDPLSGAVLDVGIQKYRPPADLSRHVMARDGYCVAPRCQVQAVNCDLDHTVPFSSTPNGTTRAANLAPLCRRHHRLKTFAGWELAQDSPGRFTWRTPSGQIEQSTGAGPIMTNGTPSIA